MLREKFSVAYRKYHNDGTTPSWNLYEKCSFLGPQINLKPDFKKDEAGEEPFIVERRVPPSPFDESILMKLVKQRPILYDKSHEDFRAGPLRKRAWQEIANISGWDLRTVTKRWRVMRDRFVRELRRTKNMDNNDSQIQCSAFFTEMLFLVNHVKSKTYAAEATGIEELSRENWEESGEAAAKLEVEQLETCIISLNSNIENEQIVEDTSENSHQPSAYDVDENDEFVECFAADGGNEQEEAFDGNSDGYYEEEEILDVDEMSADQHQAEPSDIIAVEDIPEEQWFNSTLNESPLSRKRRISLDLQDESPVKKVFMKSESPAPSTSDIVPEDEDAVFGRTIGLMLKKIPTHLKTSVKLKIFQSLAEFEIEHRLNEPK